VRAHMTMTGAKKNLIFDRRYGAVVRGNNAYVPPGARKPGDIAPVGNAAKADIPKLAVNGPDGTSVPSQTPSKSPSPAPSGSKVPLAPISVPAHPLTCRPACQRPSHGFQRLCDKRKAAVTTETAGAGQERHGQTDGRPRQVQSEFQGTFHSASSGDIRTNLPPSLINPSPTI
jgi:hypothetical protein